MKNKNPKILILIGAPGAGKTTFAKYFLRTEENWMRVNRDDFRSMHFSQTNMSEIEESMITTMIDGSIEALLMRNYNVIVDATHCKLDYINHYILKFSNLADIQFKVFDLAINELKERCKKREDNGKHIPIRVIEKYYNELAILKDIFDFKTIYKTEKIQAIKQQNNELPKAIICDLDGTLSLLNGRNPYDASACDKDLLNEPVAKVLKLFYANNYQIILLSGREDKYKDATLRFLKNHNIPYNALHMRKTDDTRKDSIIKKQIFINEIAAKYYIEFILDDRNQVVDMWRNELELPCFQVYYGNF